jgi:hypothetical protein
MRWGGLRRTSTLWLKAPGPLAGMSYPHAIDWHTLHGQGFRYVVCLTDAKPPYTPAPLEVLFSADMQDLFGGADPRKPEYEENCVRSAVALIIPRLRANEGVVVHCVGRYRPYGHSYSLYPQVPGTFDSGCP